MSNTNELDKTIEELEAEVIAELDEAKTKRQPNDSGLTKEPGSKIEGERQDMGPAVVSPDAKSDPGKEASKKAKPVKGDAQQKGEKEDARIAVAEKIVRQCRNASDERVF